MPTLSREEDSNLDKFFTKFSALSRMFCKAPCGQYELLLSLLIQIVLGTGLTCCRVTRHRSLIFVALPCMFFKFLECTQGGKLLDRKHYKYPNK